MKINDLFRSKKSLAAADLGGKAVRVTIESVSSQKFDEGEKPILHFVGKEKTLVLNRVNAFTIINAVGDDESEAWVGWSIVLYPTKVLYQGKMVDAIRVDDRPGSTKPPTAPVRKPVEAPEPWDEPSSDMPAADDIDFQAMRYIILDLESHAIPDAATYLTEPVDAPSNYVKQEAKDAFIAKAKQAQLDKAALDIDLARIVCLGVLDVTSGVAATHVMKDQTQEMTVVGRFADHFVSHNTADWPILVTFNGLGFDLPLLLRRALYLGVKAPNIQIDRFKHPHVIDLMALLSLDGRMKSHSLRFYANRFGIPVNDESTGADIGALVAEGNWASVEQHCAADVATTYALAKRMGILG